MAEAQQIMAIYKKIIIYKRYFGGIQWMGNSKARAQTNLKKTVWVVV